MNYKAILIVISIVLVVIGFLMGPVVNRKALVNHHMYRGSLTMVITGVILFWGTLATVT